MKIRKISALIVFCAILSLNFTPQRSEKVYEIVNPGNQMAENFNRDPITGWRFMPGVRVVSADRGRMLSITGPGYGHWVKANVLDFNLEFRYRHSNGTGEVLLRCSGTAPQDNAYHVRFADNRIEVIKQRNRQQRLLGESACRLQAGQWHDVKIHTSRGKITIFINRQSVINTVEQQPLPRGILSFGCLNGGGFAYDDIRLSSRAFSEKMIGRNKQDATPANKPGPIRKLENIRGTSQEGRRFQDKIPQLAEETLRNLRRIPGRNDLIRALTADPSTAEILYQLSGMKEGETQRLETHTLDGSLVTGEVQSLVLPKKNFKEGFRISPDAPVAPAGALKSINDFNWKAGVTFTPLSPYPHYWAGGRKWDAVEMKVSEVELRENLTNAKHLLIPTHPEDLPEENFQDIAFRVEVEPGTAVYMFAVKILPEGKKDLVPKALLSQNSFNEDLVTLLVIDGKTVKLTSLADNSGYVGIGKLEPGLGNPGISTRLNPKCSWISGLLRLRGVRQKEGIVITCYYFASITLTKL